jgi:predicted nuclease of predicted toxin-antitoxin system
MVSRDADFLSESGVTGNGSVGIWMRILDILATQSEILVPFSVF